MYWRVARAIAAVEGKYGASQDGVDYFASAFYEMMSQMTILAQ